jgi:hypothetical protein
MKGAIYGYARRQARRDVYRAYRGYSNYRKSNPVVKRETTDKDEAIGLIVLSTLGIIFIWMIIGAFC